MRSSVDWGVVVAVFVWTVRASCKLFNGNCAPYEIIIGMRPRSPIGPLLASSTGVFRQSCDRYVNDLCEYPRKVHKQVAGEHTRIREDSQRRKYRELGSDGYLVVGDYVMLKKEPEKGVSARFQDKAFDLVLQVVESHDEGPDARAYALIYLVGNRYGLGFSQPAHLDQLIPIEMLPLSQPEGDARTRLVVQRNGQPDRSAAIVAQTIDGKVYIKYDDESTGGQYVDLSKIIPFDINRQARGRPVYLVFRGFLEGSGRL